MNKLILTGLALTALAAGPAMAADMPVKAAVKVAPVANWTGLYVGVNGGGAISQNCWTFLPVAGPLDEGCAYASGVVGGAQVGVNWQTGSWVLGAEATGDWGNLDGVTNSLTVPGTRIATRVKSFATVTGRIGYLATPVLMLYVKGGGGWARDEHTNTILATGAPFANASETRSGWAGGAGIEWAFLNNLTWALDYTYIGLGRNTVAFAAVPGGAFAFNESISQNLQALTIKLNYKFWGAM